MIKKSDGYAYYIGFDEFEELTIELLRFTREAIIQLTMIIQIEEDKTMKNHDPQKPIGSMSLSEYNDDWKRIW